MAGFSGGSTAINSYQFYASRVMMERMGSSTSAATESSFALAYSAPLEAKTPLEVLFSDLNSSSNTVMYERASYMDLNLQREAGTQTDLYEERSNKDSFQSRNIIP